MVCGQAGRDSAPGSSSERSVTIYQNAIAVATQLHDLKLLGMSYYNLGGSYYAANKVEKAVESYEKSAEYFNQAGLLRDTIYVFGDLGAIYFNQEDYQKAREYSERTIQTAESARNSNIPPGAWPDNFGRARALHTLAEIDLREGSYVEGINKLQESLKLYEQLNGQGSIYDVSIAGVYAALGKIHAEIGNYARGLWYLNKALSLAKAKSDQDTTANILNNIGYLYLEQDDYAQAKEDFDKSLTIYLTQNNQIEAAKVFLNVGVVEQRQFHYDEAERQFDRSLGAAKIAQIKDAQIAAYEGIGVVLTAKKDFAGAIQNLNNGLVFAKETGNKTRQAEILWRSAQTRYDQGDYAQSSELAQSALRIARAAHLPKLTYLATATLGQAYASQEKTDLAIETLTEAVRQLEVLREHVAGSDIEAQLFLENKVLAYQTLVDLFMAQGKPWDALVYAEKAKARVLLDVLTKDEIDLTKALSPSEAAEVQRLNRKISDLNDQVKKSESGSALPVNALYSQLDGARLEYQAFQDALYTTHPNWSRRSGRTEAFSRASVDNLTDTGKVGYLEYVVGKDHVSLFIFTPDVATRRANLKVVTLPIKPDQLADRVNEFHDVLAAKQPQYTTLARDLYRSLIAPVETQLRDVETICIVPDGVLWNVPFQALISDRDRFVIEDHAVYYSPSLSVLSELDKKKSASPVRSSLIAFGNPVIGKDEQRDADLCPLPEAEAEVASITKSFAMSAHRVLIGREATEKDFKTLAPKYSVIHLATHGVIDNRQPLYSHLLLTKTEGDLANDGRLEAREIMDMNLTADLAVLSACETANGKVAPGEGIIGLSWAFFVAGARATVVTQWKINSDSTSQLMRNFYTNLASEPSEAKERNALALRRAAVTMVNSQRYSHPFYWAGFYLVGK